MKEYTLIFNNPFKNGFRFTKKEFLVFDYMLDCTSAADAKAQEGGHILIITHDFSETLKKERGVSYKTIQNCITKLVKKGVYRKVQGVAHVYQLNPNYYGKVLNENELEDIYSLREKDLFITK